MRLSYSSSSGFRHRCPVSSSIFSSDLPNSRGPRYNEGRVLLFVISILLLAETGMRLGGEFLSGDVAHLQEVEEIVDQLTVGEDQGILLWGNSLIGDGVDEGVVEDELRRRWSGSARVGKVRPDGTTPLEWDYLLRRSVYLRGRLPYAVVIGFGPGHLADRDAADNIGRLAAHHVARRDILRVLRDEFTGFEARAAFLAARTSRLFALQDRVQPRVLDLFIPGYQEHAPLLLTPAVSAPDDRPPSAEVENPQGAASLSYRHLISLIDEAAVHGVRLILLPMPQPERWRAAAAEEELFERCRVTVLDVRAGITIPAEQYHDGVHLDSEGRSAFSRHLAPALAQLLDDTDHGLIPGRCPLP